MIILNQGQDPNNFTFRQAAETSDEAAWAEILYACTYRALVFDIYKCSTLTSVLNNLNRLHTETFETIETLDYLIYWSVQMFNRLKKFFAGADTIFSTSYT